MRACAAVTHSDEISMICAPAPVTGSLTVYAEAVEQSTVWDSRVSAVQPRVCGSILLGRALPAARIGPGRLRPLIADRPRPFAAVDRG